jgi:hypothetical protein
MVSAGFAERGKPVTIHTKKYMIQKAGELVANLAKHIPCLPGKATFVKPAFSQANPIPCKGIKSVFDSCGGVNSAVGKVETAKSKRQKIKKLKMFEQS